MISRRLQRFFACGPTDFSSGRRTFAAKRRRRERRGGAELKTSPSDALTRRSGNPFLIITGRRELTPLARRFAGESSARSIKLITVSAAVSHRESSVVAALRKIDFTQSPRSTIMRACGMVHSVPVVVLAITTFANPENVFSTRPYVQRRIQKRNGETVCGDFENFTRAGQDRSPANSGKCPTVRGGICFESRRLRFRCQLC